jgi:hypothetical protein
VARIVDFTRPPTAKERAKLEGRLTRIERPEHKAKVDRIYDRMPGVLPETGLSLRNGFVFRQEPSDSYSSDRKAPPRDLRPPATRLITSRGAALRFALTVLALVQSTRRPGAKARLSAHEIEVAGSSQDLGWTDMLAADATDSNSGGVFLTARNKRARSVRNALIALAGAGLVSIPGEPGTRNRFEDFVLLDERGLETVGEAEEYRVPTRTEAIFTMPGGFVTNGWLHVLEDSEIAVLLMVACGKGGWYENDRVVIPAEVRLRQYGIHRDAYTSARKTLDWFGLLKVEEMGRHSDGKAENAELRVHRLGLLPAGFERPAAQTMIQVLAEQIARG